jgi:hypothetical protein
VDVVSRARLCRICARDEFLPDAALLASTSKLQHSALGVWKSFRVPWHLVDRHGQALRKRLSVGKQPTLGLRYGEPQEKPFSCMDWGPLGDEMDRTLAVAIGNAKHRLDMLRVFGVARQVGH